MFALVLIFVRVLDFFVARIVPDKPLKEMLPNHRAEMETEEFRHSLRTNSLGLRSPEPDPAAGQRVLVLGDSFGFSPTQRGAAGPGAQP